MFTILPWNVPKGLASQSSNVNVLFGGIYYYLIFLCVKDFSIIPKLVTCKKVAVILLFREKLENAGLKKNEVAS